MMPSLTKTTLQQPVSTDQSDSLDSLFQRVADGDDYLAFERIFKSTYKSLCGLANNIVRSHELAEETVDDVFCNLWRNRKRIRISTSFRSYLLTSVRNKSLDCLRRLKNEKNMALDSVSEVASGQSIATDTMAYEELSARIDLAIQSLPRQCRTIFLMSRDQNLKYKEIAEILKISIKTVDTQMGRALKQLRKAVIPERL